MVNISSQYTSTQNSYWLRALAPFFNRWTFKLQLNQISIGTTVWCSEQIKYQRHTRISICLIYEFAEVQLTWPQLIWPQLFSSLPSWAGFCLCSQLPVGWAALLIFTCSYVGIGWLLASLEWPRVGQPGQFQSVPGELSSRKLAGLGMFSWSKVYTELYKHFSKPLLVSYLLASCWPKQIIRPSAEKGMTLPKVWPDGVDTGRGEKLGLFFFFTVDYCTNILEYSVITL